MGDDEEVRALLTAAATVPDTVQPPIGQLLRRGRRARRFRAAGAVLVAAAATAAALAVPLAIRTLSPGPTGQPPAIGGLFPSGPSRQSPGPGAAQLAGFRWSELPPSPLGPRGQPVLAWTGNMLLELGGFRQGSSQGDGAAYDPAVGRWHRIAQVQGNVGFSNAVDVWTGRQLFVYNGLHASCLTGSGTPCLPRAGLYDPATNQWTTTLPPRQIDQVQPVAAVWTGRDVLLAGVRVRPATLRVAAYDPGTNQWRMITPILPAGHPPVGLAMVATSDRVILWSLWSRSVQISSTSGAVYSGVDVLALDRSGQWSLVTGNWPQHQTVDSPGYANDAILLQPSQIWCGLCSHPGWEYAARLVSAVTLARRTIPPGPLNGRFRGIQPALWSWNGRALLAENTQTGPYQHGQVVPTMWITQMAAFDPENGRWTMLGAPPGQPPLAANPAWAGRELLLLTASGKLLDFHR